MKHLIWTMVFYVGLIMQGQLVMAFSLQEGTYKGSHYDSLKKGKAAVYLMLKPVSGREGSFLAVLMKSKKRKKQVSFYVMDLASKFSYSLTPLDVTTDGQIGIINDDPSLVLSMSTGEKNKYSIKITSSNSGNTKGFSGYMVFEERSDNYQWIANGAGNYNYAGRKNALQISSWDILEGEADAIFTTASLNGSFKISESFPQMYLINANKVLATGSKVDSIPRKIGFFIKEKGEWSGKKECFVLVNPENDRDVMTFTTGSSGSSSWFSGDSGTFDDDDNDGGMRGSGRK